MDPEGRFIIITASINHTILTLDSYFSLHQPTYPEIETFFNNLDLPKLTAEQTAYLDAPLTPSKLTTALNKITNGLSAEFYRHFWVILSPLFN